jgi:hypothetical protein
MVRLEGFNSAFYLPETTGSHANRFCHTDSADVTCFEDLIQLAEAEQAAGNNSKERAPGFWMLTTDRSESRTNYFSTQHSLVA